MVKYWVPALMILFAIAGIFVIIDNLKQGTGIYYHSMKNVEVAVLDSNNTEYSDNDINVYVLFGKVHIWKSVIDSTFELGTID